MADTLSERLPTRAEFFEKHFHVVDKCAICLEAFNDSHKPAQIRTANCQHIFGQSCIRTWMESSQTCPLCRTDLFANNLPIFMPGHSSDDESAELVFHPCHSSKEDAKAFVVTLWQKLWDMCCNQDEIFDSEIAEELSQASEFAGSGYRYRYTVHYPEGGWVEILEVAQEMIRAHFANEKFQSCEPELEEKWFPMMSRAMGWNFDIDFEEEEENSDFDYEEESESDDDFE